MKLIEIMIKPPFNYGIKMSFLVERLFMLVHFLRRKGPGHPSSMSGGISVLLSNQFVHFNIIYSMTAGDVQQLI